MLAVLLLLLLVIINTVRNHCKEDDFVFDNNTDFDDTNTDIELLL